MSQLKIVLPAAILLGGFLVCTTASYGKAEYTAKTKQKCVYCHAKQVADKAEMTKNLNDAGKFYGKNKTLEGYVEKK